MSIDLERENDPEVLRQAAILLQAENRRLLARVMDLPRALLAAQGNDRVALQLEIQSLQTQLEKRNRMLFSPSSERRQGEDGAEPKARAPQKGHGPREQKELRVVVDRHVLEKADRVCIMCNGSLEEMGDQADESEEVDVIARVRHPEARRQKYRCKCGECIETAPAPTSTRARRPLQPRVRHRLRRLQVRRPSAAGAAGEDHAA